MDDLRLALTITDNLLYTVLGCCGVTWQYIWPLSSPDTQIDFDENFGSEVIDMCCLSWNELESDLNNLLMLHRLTAIYFNRRVRSLRRFFNSGVRNLGRFFNSGVRSLRRFFNSGVRSHRRFFNRVVRSLRMLFPDQSFQFMVHVAMLAAYFIKVGITEARVWASVDICDQARLWIHED